MSENCGRRGPAAPACAPRETATAVVLAGGKSTRMGTPKCLLPFCGKPLVQHVCDQLKPRFREVLIAGGEQNQLAFLGLPVIPDEAPGQGPLMAIASVLAVSRHELNFVTACDMPWVNEILLSQLLRQSSGYDCVVPVTPAGHYEPLFAVYRKSALPAVRRALDNGERRVSAAYRHCAVLKVPLFPGQELQNINTMDHYNRLCAREPEMMVHKAQAV